MGVVTLIEYVLSAFSPTLQGDGCVETEYARVVSLLPNNVVLHSCTGFHSRRLAVEAAFEAWICDYAHGHAH